MNLRPLARKYLYAIALAACFSLAAWTWLGRHFVLGPEVSAKDLALLGELLLLGVLSQFFTVPVTYHYKVLAADAIIFATLLLFGPPITVAFAALSEVLGQSLLVVRRMRSTRSILFNTSQFTVAVSLAGLAWVAVPQPLNVPAAAVTWYLANTLAVALMTGFQSGRPPLELWKIGRRRNIVEVTALLLLGVMTARVAVFDLWGPTGMGLLAAIVYLSMKRNAQLEEQTVSAVAAMADIVDRRDHYTAGHCRRVADYAHKIARAMRLPTDEVEKIRLAARVHDLGKIGVPDAVLFKPGKLSGDEWTWMRRHPEIGHKILSYFPQYREGSELVRSHHERYDGQGYPRALGSESVAVGAHIIAVADTLDAMTTDRPYRKGLPLETALAELQRGAGTQFAPHVVAALERLVAGSGASALDLPGRPAIAALPAAA